MATKFDKKIQSRLRRKKHIRKIVRGSGERPRLVVFRSLKNIEGQIVDDEKRVTLIGVSSLCRELDKSGKNKVAVSKATGELLARKALEKGITQIVFDRNGYLYHGRIKAFAEGVRQGGLIVAGVVVVGGLVFLLTRRMRLRPSEELES